MKRLLVLLSCSALLGAAASAQTMPSQMPGIESPSGAAPSTKGKGTKPKPKTASTGQAGPPTAAPPARKKDSDYLKTLQAPRRITKEDLEDDPSAPASPRLRPMMTPEGRPAMGGSF